MLTLVLALLAGVVTVAAPCMLPMLPILLGASVGQAGKAFNPADLQVKVGDSVKFNNDDTVDHAVLVKGPHESNLGQIKPGDAKSVSFDQAGTYDVRCAIHPKMKLTITVQ